MANRPFAIVDLLTIDAIEQVERAGHLLVAHGTPM
jgi:hypothetical protein